MSKCGNGFPNSKWRKKSWVVFLFLLYSLIKYTNDRVHCGPMVILFLCTLHYPLPSLCRRIWRYRTSKILVRYNLLSVCQRLITFHAIYGAVCIRFTVSHMMIVRVIVFYLDIIIKSDVWPICHCLGLGHEIMVCAVCLLFRFTNVSSSALMSTGLWYFSIATDLDITEAYDLLFFLVFVDLVQSTRFNGTFKSQVGYTHMLQEKNKNCEISRDHDGYLNYTIW